MNSGQFNPTEQQLAVIDSTAPIVVVLGGAGAGKTTTAAAAAAKRLSDLAAKRAAARRATPFGITLDDTAGSRVLFLSFSRTSVSQILDRVSKTVGRFLSQIDVMTFHGLAWRILNDFGRYYGVPYPLRVQTAFEAKLGFDIPGMTYDDLIPAAMRILGFPLVSEFFSKRYGLVICDEFQDTSDSEWKFMQSVAPTAQRILLGDENQCIYASLKSIDPAARISEACTLPGAELIALPPLSFRDPSGVLPAAAYAALHRRMNDPAITSAVQEGRLILDQASGNGVNLAALEIVEKERAYGNSVAIFTHTNTSTAELSSALLSGGVDHEQVGFAEAFGAALQAQLELMRWTLEKKPGARQALAVYLRSITRGKGADEGAYAILDKSSHAFEDELRRVGADLRAVATPSPDINRILDVLKSAHSQLGFPRGEETWAEANSKIGRVAREYALSDFAFFETEVDRIRSEVLVDNIAPKTKTVQVMNLHQTKGREADVTVLVLQEDEYYGREGEPFPEGSRLLYVCLTRARKRAYIVVPEGPAHALWQPLIDSCVSAQTVVDNGVD